MVLDEDSWSSWGKNYRLEMREINSFISAIVYNLSHHWFLITTITIRNHSLLIQIKTKRVIWPKQKPGKETINRHKTNECLNNTTQKHIALRNERRKYYFSFSPVLINVVWLWIINNGRATVGVRHRQQIVKRRIESTMTDVNEQWTQKLHL